MSKRNSLYSGFRFTSVLTVSVCAGLLLTFTPSMAQFYGTISTDIEQAPSLKTPVSITAALQEGHAQGKRFEHINAIRAFYQNRNNKLFWTAGFFSSYEPRLFETFKNAWTHGLNPTDYHVQALAGREASDIERELLLMDGFIRYAQDLSGMRVDPAGLKIDPQSWRQRPSADAVLAVLETSKDFEDALKKIHPKSRTYELLRKELITLSRSPEPDYASILPLGFGRTIRPNERHKRMDDLRMRLGVTSLTQDQYLYDDRLIAAVIKFQREHGLKDDGVIGPQTLRALNLTKADLMRQLVVNLERLRWAPEDRPEKYVVVNIPSATLWAVDQGRLAFEMPVIVGRPKRATESFIADIKGVRFNPNWTIPPTIKKKDMLPKLQNDPEYFANKGIEIYTGYGRDAQTLDPTAIDWDEVTMGELQGLRMVQSPGRHNALGQIRVLMPNRFNIYLHDTNEQYLFNKSARAVSSGCIRLKEPEKMASFIMRGQKEWSDDKMARLLASSKTKERYVDETIPVYIFYYTVWVDNRGRVVYGTDIYKQDELLIDKLAKVDGFRIPGHNIKSKGSSARPKLVSVK